MTISNKNIFRSLAAVHILLFALYLILSLILKNNSEKFYYQLMLSRIFIVTYTFLLGILFVQNVEQIKYIKTSPTGLSVLRIVFFGIIFIGGIVRFDYMIAQFQFFMEFINPNNLPDSLSKYFWSLIPYNPKLVQIFFIILIIAAFLACIGLKTKIAISIFCLTSIYLFAIPNLTGKINHNHDLFWIPFILAFSNCGDRYSFDSLIKSSSPIQINNSNNKNTITISLIWLMLGICYFFPGFWKIWNSGLDWALTDNVKYHMHSKWLSLDNYSPIIRFDHYPIFYKLGGLFTLWFEISFVFLLPFKWLRRVGVVMGLLFHLGTWFTLNIFFGFFVLSYLPLIMFSWKKSNYNNLKESNRQPFKFSYFIQICLLAGFAIYGALRIDSWPLSGYPRFDTMLAANKKSLIAYHCLSIDTCNELNKEPIHLKYSPERLSYLEDKIIYNYSQSSTKLQELHKLYQQTFSNLQQGSINYYIKTQSLDPDSASIYTLEPLMSIQLSPI